MWEHLRDCKEIDWKYFAFKTHLAQCTRYVLMEVVIYELCVYFDHKYNRHIKAFYHWDSTMW